MKEGENKNIRDEILKISFLGRARDGHRYKNRQ